MRSANHGWTSITPCPTSCAVILWSSRRDQMVWKIQHAQSIQVCQWIWSGERNQMAPRETDPLEPRRLHTNTMLCKLGVYSHSRRCQMRERGALALELSELT